MRKLAVLSGFCLLLAIGVLTTGAMITWAEPAGETTIKSADQQFSEGNYRDALEIYQKIALRPTSDPGGINHAFSRSLAAFTQLGREHEIDAFRENMATLHAANGRVLQHIATSYVQQNHQGFIVEGEFRRGGRRNAQGGEWANASARDRVRALQLFQQALPLMSSATPEQQGAFYLQFAQAVVFMKDGPQTSWRLQALTDLAQLPDYDTAPNQPVGVFRGRGMPISGSSARGAAVDAEGNPVFYQVPKSWETAANDGERWRWLLEQARTVHPPLNNQTLWIWGSFLHENFGVQTMMKFIRPLIFRDGAADAETGLNEQTGPFAVSTLEETETIARLANGVKRFPLPEEFNFIRVFQQIVAQPETGYAEQALQQLITIFENRQQYPRAAEYLRQSIKQFKDEDNIKAQRLSQIVDPWGTFEGTRVKAAGDGAELDFRFRNGDQLQLVAYAVNYQQLLQDVKNHIKSKPATLDWNKINVGDIGHRLVYENEQKYLGKKVAQWELKLDPRPNHFDRRISVSTPLKNAGAYLLIAKMKNGNTSRIIVWLDDTSIVNKPMAGQQWYYVADAKTGAPVPDARLDFFGYRVEHSTPRRHQIHVTEFADRTDAEGQVLVGPKRMGENYNYLITATTPDGRFASLGFNGVWFHNPQQEAFQQNRVYIITDRPVYRPGQKVHFKVWVQRADFTQDDKSVFAGQTFPLQITNPRDEKLLESRFTADDFGGFSGELELPEEAALGVYQVQIPWQDGVGGNLNFRVEEYKKPEFEVLVDAPAAPVQLGEKITATIKAKYYFGAPVTRATVKYKVERTIHDQQWYPRDRWDWLYGSGYWWFGRNYDWYPGFSRWGCIAPPPWWQHRSSDPPELILEQEVEIGPDGTVPVEIETLLAKEIHGDKNHRYTITAEVTDQSRRTIVGTGSVLVAREPFQVHVWLNRGYYHTGDEVHANIKVQTLDQKPIVGEGTLTLFSIKYDEHGTPTETAVESWPLSTNAEGQAEQKFKVPNAGQYRLAYRIKDAAGNEQEGAFIFLVRGEGSTLADYRFDDLEMIPDQKSYQPGETVKLLINTNRQNSTVLLFVRPVNGNYQKPQMLHLTGKSTVVDIGVEAKDLPNFFVEAVTIGSAKLFQELRDIPVPPEQRALNVTVEPSADRYQPGQEAEVTIKVTDLDGKPVTSSTVLSVYDRSIEMIAGGSNVPEILEFFWNFRRHHHPHQNTSLERSFHILLKKGEVGMMNLGAFGHLTAEISNISSRSRSGGMGGGGGFGGGMGGDMMMEKAMPAAAPMMAEPRQNAVSFDLQNSVDSALEESSLVQPTIRTDFADSAYWNALITPDEHGIAKITFRMPENLTDWKFRTWSIGRGARVGQSEATAVTAKDVLVRLQAPRFFVEKDEVWLSAIVHNALKETKQAKVELVLEGGTLEALDDLSQVVTVASDGSVRVDWKVKAVQEGQAVITMKALTDTDSDAMQMTFPVFVHGILKMESYTGVVRNGAKTGQFEVTVPEARRPEQTRLEIRYSPTLAGALVDALPYLIDYPHGCTEQTLNRFLPSAITQNVLNRMGVKLEEIKKHQTNLNAQELGDPAERAAQWKRFRVNPVFDTAEMQEIVKTGVQRLADMQLADGGWGWFSGYGERSFPHTTAVVVRGLLVAKENGIELNAGMLEKGLKWLERYQQEQVRLLKKGAEDKPKHPYRTVASDIDALVYMILTEAGVQSQPMQDYLYRDRTKLSVYSLGMLGLALHKLQVADRLDMILQNIEQYYVEDLENETAYLKLPAGSFWWLWHGSEIEANAFYLKLLSRTDPKGVRAPRLVKYLLNNRKHATYWSSTRDTALCIEAMAEFLQASGEDQPELTVEVLVDGTVRKTVQINRDNLFTFDGTVVLAGEELSSGKHSVEFRTTGTGPLYWNAYLTNFTLEDPITAAGLELQVRRRVYKLVPRENETALVPGSRGQASNQNVQKFDRIELKTGDEVASGDLLEIELGIDSKNDYEYIILEDFKAAGNEPVEVQSGYLADANGAYVEFRDERVVFFLRALQRGTSSMSYRLRAEIPGRFSALPAVGAAMYAPELKANSDEFKLQIRDR